MKVVILKMRTIIFYPERQKKQKSLKFNKWFWVLMLTIVILNISCKINPTISKHSAPTAIFTINPTSGTTTTTFVFDASGSSDTEDATSVLQVRWNWDNDSIYDTNYSTTKTANHQYVTHGTYTVKLEVKNNAGLTNTTITVVSVQQHSAVVTFPDSNFEILIRETLNKSTGDITQIDLENITEIDGNGRNISDVSGIEYCTNLEILNLWSNQIMDISDLSNLTNLKVLNLNNNRIVDVTVLSGLPNLQSLDLWHNQIMDISSLNNLTNLEVLNLNNNQIIDIYPLIQNNGIDNNDKVYLNRNSLNAISINTYIPQLETRGVTVYYDIGLSDPSFGFISENWIPQYEKGPMNSIWQSEGINREGYNYYFLPKAVSPYVCSDRFNPTSNYFQSWFGMYTVSDNSDGIYAINNQELNQEDILKLAIADQIAWLKGFAGLDTPLVYLDSNVEIIKEKIVIDSQDGWRLSGRLISNIDVGNNNQIDVPDIINIKKQYWEDKVTSYQQVFLDAYAYVWYAHENKELNVAYFNGVEYLSRDGTTYRTIEKIYSELEEMVLNITVYE